MQGITTTREAYDILYAFTAGNSEINSFMEMIEFLDSNLANLPAEVKMAYQIVIDEEAEYAGR